ncbi:LysR family transcriptional regulator [Massilia sp. TS11]|uniref:LysR family transcriptional regulator n=1 Tax=Massilia sp. TS11 TaxID=2908003 RepID=UPI001EDB51DB|nr:LysR family transcriptional regulator [Massilia sp. TS11]MCG2585415.1 LysR family transcriptional regulator [Massilia sp. TS11]
MNSQLAWDDLRLFLAVAENGSLSAAARQLRLGQPTLSRRIGELEAAVGETLFVRENHGTRLTPLGEKLLPAVQQMAEWARAAEAVLEQDGRRPEGRVRVTAPPGIAFEFLAPLAAEIRQTHPRLQLDVLSSIDMLNLSRGEADIALRSLRPQDPDLVVVDLLRVPMRVYASAAYAARLPAQPRVEQLDWIAFAAPYADLSVNRELARRIPDFRPVFASDDFNVQVAACKAGVGAMVLAHAPHPHSVLQGLVALPIDLGGAEGELVLVCHKRHRHLPKVEAVLTHLQRGFAAVRAAL